MDFTHDEEQVALRDAIRSLLVRRYGNFEERRRTVRDTPGHDPALWKQLAEMGVLGLPFAEEVGGMGAGPVEVGLVATEMGRVLAPEPFLSCVVTAGGLVDAVGTAEQRSEVLGAVSAGTRQLAFAHDEPGHRWRDTASTVTAGRDGESWTLTGTKEPVLHGDADQLVVSAALPDGGTGLFLVDGEATRRSTSTAYDGTRVSRVTLEATPATPLGAPGADVTATVAAVLDRARVAVCHEALGGMEVALETTTAYLRTRRQFGVTLNTFQALTFAAADMYVELELTRSVVAWATMVVAEGDAAVSRDAVSRAALQTSRAARHVGQQAIQLHGGIGMTAEYPVGNVTAHLTALDHLFGDGQHHLSRLAAVLEDHEDLDPLAG